MEETQDKNWGWIFILVIALIWSIFFQKDKDKYEGQTAEEWFNDYDEAEAKYQQLHDCVEPYATANGYIPADDLYYECF